MLKAGITRAELEAMGYEAWTVHRGGGLYGNDIAGANRVDWIFDEVIKAVNEGTLIEKHNPLLKETWLYSDALTDSYRGTEIIYYLRRCD